MGRSLRRRALASLYHVLPLHPSQETVLGSLGCLSNQGKERKACALAKAEEEGEKSGLEENIMMEGGKMQRNRERERVYA